MEENNNTAPSKSTQIELWNDFYENQQKTGQFTPLRIWKKFCEEHPTQSNHDSLQKIKESFNENILQTIKPKTETSTTPQTLLKTFEYDAKEAGFNERQRNSIKKLIIAHTKNEIINLLRQQDLIPKNRSFQVKKSINAYKVVDGKNKKKIRYLQKLFSNTFELETVKKDLRVKFLK